MVDSDVVGVVAYCIGDRSVWLFNRSFRHLPNYDRYQTQRYTRWECDYSKVQDLLLAYVLMVVGAIDNPKN